MADDTSPSPFRFQEYGRRAESLLRSMEGNFLEILADHQAERAKPPLELAAPKEAAASDGGGGSESDSFLPYEVIEITIEVDREALEMYFDAHMHIIDHGCQEGLSTMARLGGMVTQTLVLKAQQAGWFNIPEEGE